MKSWFRGLPLPQFFMHFFLIEQLLWKDWLCWVGQKVPMVFAVKWNTHFSFSPTTSLIWVFWVRQPSPAWQYVDGCQLLSGFGRYQLQLVYLTVEHRPGRDLQHKTLLTRSISHNTFSIHCTNHFLCFEMVKHNMLKMLIISSIFNIKMATQKFTNFDIFFKYTLRQQLSQYNLIKLFWMKLKTTKWY